MGNEKTRFKKGQSGNPLGRMKLPEDIKEARKMNNFELERILNKCVFMTLPEIQALSSDENINSNIFEMTVAKILHNAFKYGDAWKLDFILNRLIGRVREAPPPTDLPPPSTATINVTPIKRSFDDFALEAKYFKPFPKQHEMRAFGLDETDTRLLLGSRGYGKTEYITIMGTAYDVYSNWFDFVHNGGELTSTNLIITKTNARSKSLINEISEALKANGVPLEVDNATEIRVKGLVGQNHSVEGITIKTSMRGRHPYRIIMDDPVTDEDVSAAIRKLVKKKYDEAMKLTKNILIIGQPAHAFDLYAGLRGIIKTMEVPHGTIPELDIDLEMLRFSGVDADSITMSYHLKVPETGTMPFAKLNRSEKFPNGDCVAFIDPSEGKDYTALAIMRKVMDEVHIIGFAWKKAWYHCVDDMIPILKARGVRRLCFETNKHGDQPVFQLRKMLKDDGIGVVGKYSDSNKHAVIMAAGSYSHLIHLSMESDVTYANQVIQYEYGVDFDDAPDSMARCLEWVGLIKGKG